MILNLALHDLQYFCSPGKWMSHRIGLGKIGGEDKEVLLGAEPWLAVPKGIPAYRYYNLELPSRYLLWESQIIIS